MTVRGAGAIVNNASVLGWRAQAQPLEVVEIAHRREERLNFCEQLPM